MLPGFRPPVQQRHASLTDQAENGKRQGQRADDELAHNQRSRGRRPLPRFSQLKHQVVRRIDFAVVLLGVLDPVAKFPGRLRDPEILASKAEPPRPVKLTHCPAGASCAADGATAPPPQRLKGPRWRPRPRSAARRSLGRGCRGPLPGRIRRWLLRPSRGIGTRGRRGRRGRSSGPRRGCGCGRGGWRSR